MQQVDIGGHDVRMLTIDGEPWFAADDVCKALDVDPSALNGLDHDERGVYTVQAPGGIEEITIVSEPGLYGLLLWDSPKGGAALRWLFGEVLPSIQAHGCYPPNARGKLLNDPERLLEVTERLVEQVRKTGPRRRA